MVACFIQWTLAVIKVTLEKNNILLILWLFLLLSCNDGPTKLSGKVETIELSYVGWACDCAEWATPDEIKKYHSQGDTLAQLSIFIEAEGTVDKIPDELKNPCCGNKIRFIGQFYTDKGISRDYEQQFQKPDKARVFKYSSFEIVKPYSAWDFNTTSEAGIKIIK